MIKLKQRLRVIAILVTVTAGMALLWALVDLITQSTDTSFASDLVISFSVIAGVEIVILAIYYFSWWGRHQSAPMNQHQLPPGRQ